MKPFVKWAGGKTQLLDEIKKRLPQNYNDYYEIFVGGGALFFNLPTRNAFINDKNRQLINCYYQIAYNKEQVVKKLRKMEKEYNKLASLDSKKDYYYSIRDKFNRRMFWRNLTYLDACYLIFLNKTCFNGLYRINSSGLFNSPFGKRMTITLFDENNINEVSEKLQNTAIYNEDFETACNSAEDGDFVFIDSPYYDTFDTYQSGGFTEEDHKRLAALVRDLYSRGCFVMVTNSNTDFIKELYSDFHIDIIKVKRMINADANNRTGEEVIITTYDKRYYAGCTS